MQLFWYDLVDSNIQMLSRDILHRLSVGVLIIRNTFCKCPLLQFVYRILRIYSRKARKKGKWENHKDQLIPFMNLMAAKTSLFDRKKVLHEIVLPVFEELPLDYNSFGSCIRSGFIKIVLLSFLITASQQIEWSASDSVKFTFSKKSSLSHDCKNVLPQPTRLTRNIFQDELLCDRLLVNDF